jgi:hypothetical protein
METHYVFYEEATKLVNVILISGYKGLIYKVFQDFKWSTEAEEVSDQLIRLSPVPVCPLRDRRK